MRSSWMPKGEMEHVLAALHPENRLACEISLLTGMRINDVLALTPKRLKNSVSQYVRKRRARLRPCDYQKMC